MAHLRRTYGLDSLLLAAVFGYCSYRLAGRLSGGSFGDSIGIKLLLGVGLLACLAMTLFGLVGFWRSLRRQEP